MSTCICRYCGRNTGLSLDNSAEAKDGSFHNPACPEITGQYQSWERGCDWGFVEGLPSSEAPARMSDTFYLGVDFGYCQISSMTDAAAEANYWEGPRVEY